VKVFFVLKSEFLKIIVNLQTVFVTETHPAEEQWLEEQWNMVKQ
jgi:hypothetical protein